MITVNAALNDPAASDWFKDALRSALKRDPVDAVNEAAYLLSILRIWQGEVAAEAEAKINAMPEGPCFHCGRVARLERNLCGPCLAGLRSSW